MSLFEFNKILASLIISIIIFFIIGYLGNMLINPENPQEQAYKIDIPEDVVGATSTISGSQGEVIEPVSAILASASIENGMKISKKCSSCHSFKKDEQHKVGPNLFGILGSEVGKINEYSYSNSMANFGGKWNYENLSAFLYKPKEYMEGTKMNFIGLKNVEDRADLILWLLNWFFTIIRRK